MKVFVLRGPSGSGKSTEAKKLIAEATNPIICSADGWFMKDGRYEFDVKQLGQAHAWCRGKFVAAMELCADVIVIDNTNTSKWEYQPYMDLALANGYDAEIVMIGTLDDQSLKTYANRNKHGVPLDVIRKQASRIAKSK